jgi:hypothetical protein
VKGSALPGPLPFAMHYRLLSTSPNAPMVSATGLKASTWFRKILSVANSGGGSELRRPIAKGQDRCHPKVARQAGHFSWQQPSSKLGPGRDAVVAGSLSVTFLSR